MSEEAINFEMNIMLQRYAAGVAVADIADEFDVHVNTIYKQLRDCPDAYEHAKRELTHLRNSKYRRAGALAIDEQLKYLEDIAASDDRNLRAHEINKIMSIGENAERRADLNEGKATERAESVTKIIMFDESEKE